MGAGAAVSWRGRDSACRKERLAFYDALETNDRALKVLREDTLQHIVRGLAGTVRRNVQTNPPPQPPRRTG